MKENSRNLSSDQLKLASSRQKAEFIVNSALNWIERFHSEADHNMLGRLIAGIRALVGAMQGRSYKEIDLQTDKLLEVQSHLALPQIQPISESESNPTDNNSIDIVRRIHQPWQMSDYFSADEHENRTEQKKIGSVFISYARADSAWLEKLKIHMHPLVRAGKVEIWHDGMIDTGKSWIHEIKTALNGASSAILLLSANFMASDFIYTHELQPIIKRASEGGVVVFPLVIGHCLFEEDRYLKHTQAFNDPESPLSRLESSEIDRILVDLSRAVRDIRGGSESL